MHKPRDKVGDVIRLAKQFKELSDALGSKIKAAHHLPTFEQFLDAKEKVMLQEYKVVNDPTSV